MIVNCVLSLQLYNKVNVGETLSVDTISAYLKTKFPKANADRILGVESEYDEKRKVRRNTFLFIVYTKSKNNNTLIFMFCVRKEHSSIRKVASAPFL